MKRDMDLIRAVVLKAVEGDPNGVIPPTRRFRRAPLFAPTHSTTI